MNVFLAAAWVVVVCINSDVKGETRKDLDHEDVGSIDYGNATTSEMRDRVLAEWKGRTDEIQGYFDQLPSEEFKENSEDRKFKFYYEQKGIKGIDTNQVFNVTPKHYEPVGPVYTIEVNDSYVPKYRITTSEEERMEKYGTFNSESGSSEISSEEVKRKKKKKKRKSSEESSGEKKKKKEKKTWPSNMDPKEKRKKKKTKTPSDEKKRKDLEKTLNGANTNRKNVKTVQKEILRNKGNNHHDSQTKMQGNNLEYVETEDVLKRKDKLKSNSQLSLKNKDSKSINKSNLNHKLTDDVVIENKTTRHQRRRKGLRQSLSGMRPFL